MSVADHVSVPSITCHVSAPSVASHIAPCCNSAAGVATAGNGRARCVRRVSRVRDLRRHRAHVDLLPQRPTGFSRCEARSSSVATSCRCDAAASRHAALRHAALQHAMLKHGLPHEPQAPRVNTHSCSARVRSRGGSRRTQAASAAPRGSAASPPSGSCPALRSAKERARASETSHLAMGALCRQGCARCVVAVVEAGDAQQQAAQ